jgi:hypothetical protein
VRLAWIINWAIERATRGRLDPGDNAGTRVNEAGTRAPKPARVRRQDAGTDTSGAASPGEDPLANIVTALKQFATDKDGDYARWHQPKFGDRKRKAIANTHLQRFFDATMDEVRLWHASQYGYEVLALTDVEDFDHFRRGVLRREVSGEIAYPKQRDHSGHTLYNYLLGWYFYSQSPLVKKQMNAAFAKRILVTQLDDAFADMWAYVSLLHDVGYLFEGALAPLSSKIQDDQIRIGAEVSQEYFSHRFWTQLGLAGVDDRNAATALSGVEIPELESRSMTGLAYSLRLLGDLEPLRKGISNCNDPKFQKSPIVDEAGLPEDAFDLWKVHYAFFDSATMGPRIDYLEDVFLHLMQNGFAGTGVRVLDHGICSGLLLLLAATFYFRIAYGMDPSTRPQDKRQLRAWTKIKENSEFHQYSPTWWWQATVWATAATAIHNVAQMKPMEGLRTPHPGPLSMEEDPLAYLGILVDVLQEWDRPTVARLSPVTGIGPLQGVDLTVKPRNGVLHLAFDSRDRAAEVTKSLDRALQGWDELVAIKP